MDNEIKALREEIARLRERIAVLEARPVVPVEQLRIGPNYVPPKTSPFGSPYTVGDPPGWWLNGPTAGSC